jgi:hypothetical protein
MPPLFLAPFSIDASPPIGHPLCGGWIEPARAIDDPLRAVGAVLLGPAAPVVLCAVDWCGLRNDAHLAWTTAIAKAAHTTPERVAVQCVHPHNAPFADVAAQKLIDATPGAPANLDLKFFSRLVDQVAHAVASALKNPLKFDQVGIGKGRVEQVASNRRVLGTDGKVRFVRTSATKNPAARAEPEGLIDPWLRSLTFWHGGEARLAFNYYATHPMSYYGDGRVTSDFCGLARDRRAVETKTPHVYFTGCAGNVTAGKYNDGEKANRAVLRDRMIQGMRAAWRTTVRHDVETWSWRSVRLKLDARAEANFSAESSEKVLKDPRATKAARGNAALQLAWRARLDRPIDVTCLEIGAASVLHLPGEPFIEYQLAAQKARPDRFVCVAGYGDGGMGYIPTDAAFLQGGYEPTVALAAPCEKRFLEAIRAAVKGK